MVSVWMVGLNIFRHAKSLTTQKALPPGHVMFWRYVSILTTPNRNHRNHGPVNTHLPPTTGLSFQPKRRCFIGVQGAKGNKNMKNGRLDQNLSSLFNQFKLLSTGPGAQYFFVESWHHPFFNIEQFFHGSASGMSVLRRNSFISWALWANAPFKLD